MYNSANLAKQVICGKCMRATIVMHIRYSVIALLLGINLAVD